MTSVTQIGTDRIIELQFSDGLYRLFLEFYAAGNIILTNQDCTILSLFRSVPDGVDQGELRVGAKYALVNRQNLQGTLPLTKESLRKSLEAAVSVTDGPTTGQAKKMKKKAGSALRKTLATFANQYPPALLDHALLLTNFDTSIAVEDLLKADTLLCQLILAFKEAEKITSEATQAKVPKGYVIAKFIKSRDPEANEKYNPDNDSKPPSREAVTYEDFHPFRPRQFDGKPETYIFEFDGFNRTVDEFFSSVESQKLQSRLQEREEHAKKKLQSAKHEHNQRLGGLQQIQEMHTRKALAIELNLERVHEAIAAVNGLIAQGMDWVEIARLIEVQQSRHNAVAEMIKLPLKLHENTVTLLLAEDNLEEEEAGLEEDQTDDDTSKSEDEILQPPADPKSQGRGEHRLSVDVDLALSPWANAREYYDQKKVVAVKEQKTLQSSVKALKNTEQKITADLKKGLKLEKELLRPVRQQLWFEKFIFFISSEGYLVLGGRDAQQAEILYQRHLKKGDVYVNADFEGAASVIVKNKAKNAEDPIPPATLSQAGTLAVVTSGAWDSKAVVSAWWVQAPQVSKVTPIGDYLQPGKFFVKSDKTYLPPVRLLLGLAVMFRINEKSKVRHLKHRTASEDISRDESIHSRADTNQAAGYQRIDENQNSNQIEGHYDPNDLPNAGEALNEDDSPESTEANSELADNSPLHEPEYYNPLDTLTRYEKDQRALTETDATQMDELLVLKEDASSKRIEEDTPEMYDTANSDGEAATQKTAHTFRAYDRAAGSPVVRQSSPVSSPVSSTQAEQETGVRHDQTSSSTNPHKAPMTAKGPSAKKNPNEVRGKRGKVKKIKEKYADQDDEDRALALRLLGSTAAAERTKNDATAEKARDQQLAAERQRRREQHKIATERGKEMEEMRQARFQDENPLSDDETEDGELDLEAFVGTPLPGDEVLDAIVMCAPWDAVGSRCRWKAKLQPGMVKKGRAIREVMSKWVATATEQEKRKRPRGDEDGQQPAEEQTLRIREAEFIRGVREQEVIGVVPVSKCRVVMGAGEVEVPTGKGSRNTKSQRGGKGSKKQR